MKTPTALSVTSSQREQTSLRSQVPRLPRSNVCSTPDLENPSASVHRKRFSTLSLTLKFLCAGKLNPPNHFIAAPHPICSASRSDAPRLSEACLGVAASLDWSGRGDGFAAQHVWARRCERADGALNHKIGGATAGERSRTAASLDAAG
jgi:hypothetical protein